MPPTVPPRVFLCIETYAAYGRRIVDGAATYCDQHRPWAFHLERRDVTAEGFRGWMRRCDGAIVAVRTEPVIAAVRACGKPVVVATWDHRLSPLPQVLADNAAVGRLAADHFHDRGLEQVAYLGTADQYYSRSRGDAFAARAAELGLHCDAFEPAQRDGYDQDVAARLTVLPKPAGLFAATDTLAQHAIDICHAAGLEVPDRVAVLGVDDDEQVCRLCHPQLSSIDHGTERIGYEAAALLDRLMRGEPPPAGPVIVPPVGVVERQSTDTLAIDDPGLRRAVRFIREQACEGIGVAGVLRAVPMARRTLEVRMRRVLGRTPQEEITRVQLERVKALLRDTDLPMPDIAARTGFSYPSRLSHVFRRVVGTTPTDFRRASRV